MNVLNKQICGILTRYDYKQRVELAIKVRIFLVWFVHDHFCVFFEKILSQICKAPKHVSTKMTGSIGNLYLGEATGPLMSKNTSQQRERK